MTETLDIWLENAWTIFWLLVASGLCVLVALFVIFCAVTFIQWAWDEIFY